jgi:hypothetical protein
VSFPSWIYFPTSASPPAWVGDFVDMVAGEEAAISSAVQSGLTSDSVLATLRNGLTGLGYTVEVSKKRVDKVRRPVLFGEQGTERVVYEVDAYHEPLGIVVEIEAGRGAMSNAVYRDLVRSSLIVGAHYLTLGVMLEYRSGKSTTQSYRDAKDLREAVYASGRLQFPFDGVLLFGY